MKQSDSTTAPPASDVEDEQKLDAQRNEAYDAEYEWFTPAGGKVPLLPFSDGRDFLLWQLAEQDGGIDWAALRDQKDDDGNVITRGNPLLFLGTAAKLIYLCMHSKDEIRAQRRDRAAMIETIEAWASKWIPRDRHLEAVLLAVRVINDATVNQAIPRPGDSAQKEGN